MVVGHVPPSTSTPRVAGAAAQNQVLLTVLGLRALGHRTALVAHPHGELCRRAAEGPDLIPIAASGEMGLRAAWQLSRVLRALRPTVVHAHDAHAVAMVALARSLGRLDPLPRFVVLSSGRFSHPAEHVLSMEVWAGRPVPVVRRTRFSRCW